MWRKCTVISMDLSAFNKEKLFANREMYFFMTCICSIFAYMVYVEYADLLYSNWTAADWAITYAGGFVRRGLSGELALIMAKAFSIHLVHAIVILKIIIYVVFASSILHIIYLKKINLVEAIYFFLPWAFSFYLVDINGIGKKEFLFLSFFLTYISLDLRKQLSLKFKFIYLFLSWNFMLLMHEAQFFFLQFFLLYEILRNKTSKPHLLKLYGPLYIFAICFFCLLFVFKGDSSHVTAIWKHLEQYNLPSIWISYGSIGGLDYGASYKLELIHITNYSISLLLLFISLFYYSYLITKKTNFLYFFLAFCISAPLYIVAIDWGRWIHVFFFSAFLCIYSTRTLKNTSFLQINKKTIPCIVLTALSLFLLLKIIPLFHTYPNQPSNRLYEIYELLHGIVV